MVSIGSTDGETGARARTRINVRSESGEERLRAAQRKLREAQRLREEQRRRVEKLRDDSKAWREAQIVRDYIEPVRGLGGDESWIEWALARAEEMDPWSE